MIDLSAESPDRIADWIELLSAAQVNKPLSLQRIISISEDQARISPNITTFAFRLLEKRAKLIGANYPFTLGEHSIATRKSVGQSIYLRLLLLTPGIGVQGICSGWNFYIKALFFYTSPACLEPTNAPGVIWERENAKDFQYKPVLTRRMNEDIFRYSASYFVI